MASLDSLFDHVMPKVPKLTVELARLELRNAAIQFCRRSKADRRTLDAFNTTAGQPLYALTLPADTALVEVVSVVLDNDVKPLDPLRATEIPPDAATKKRPQWFCGSMVGGPKVRLIYAPAAVYSAVVSVVVEPTSAAAVIDDWLAQRYGQAIAYGALEALLAMPKKPWTDPATASYYKAKFDAAILDAEDDADEGFTSAPARTRPVFGLR